MHVFKRDFSWLDTTTDSRDSVAAGQGRMKIWKLMVYVFANTPLPRTMAPGRLTSISRRPEIAVMASKYPGHFR
jgi:hypothetical protein